MKMQRSMMGLMLTLILAAVSSHAAIVNVNELNKKLEKSATWKAKDNRINQMSLTDVKRMLGVKNYKGGAVRFSALHASKPNGNLPPSVDWRNKDGQNYVSPILDQGNCGSCVAFSAVATLETQYNVSALFPGMNVKLSTQSLFACGGGGCETGWQPADAADYMKTSGVPDEACLPYTSGASGQDVSCSATCSNSAQRSYKIASYTQPTDGNFDLNALKTALQHGPLETTLAVYADFMVYSSGVYKHTTGDFMGGHAVSIVGYDDSKNALIIRNSWGEDWGDHGFIYVDYTDESGIGDETWSYSVPAMTGAVAMVSPTDYTYFSGTTNLEASTDYSNAASLSFQVYDGQNNVKFSKVTTGTRAQVSLDTTTLADGRYEVQATAMDASGKAIDHTPRNFFYVVNAAPKLTLSFTGNNVDMTQPLSDRIEMTVTSSASPVPMNILEFHIKAADGTETVRKSGVVLDQMVTGWRTNMVPNGTYEIWFVGKIVAKGAPDAVVSSSHMTVKTSN